MICLRRRVLQILLFILFLAPSVFAQSQEEQSGAHYILPGGSGASIRISINLWGEIAAPGVYQVPIGTDLVSLISGAGGPLETAKLRKVKILRAAAQDTTPRIVEANIKRYMKTGDRDALPPLQAGDTIIIPRQVNFLTSEAFTVFTRLTTSIGSLILIWDRLANRGVL